MGYMEKEEKKGFEGVYLLAIFYVVSVYMALVLYYVLSNHLDPESNLIFYPFFVPVLLGIVNYIYVFLNKEKIGRIPLLNCSILIKYTMIPIYLMGALIIAVCLLMMISPIVIMMFIGPTVAVILSVVGWVYMMGGAAYSLAYISLSKKQEVHGKILSIVATILQFFFTVDVISVMVLALKEKRCVKSTIAMLSIFVIGFIAIVVWLIVKILS